MITLRVEHKIANYDGWKKAFDSDPINRKQSGVLRYRIYRPQDDDHFVLIELDFDNQEQAEKTKQALERILPNIDGKIVFGARLTLFEVTETEL